MPFSFFGPVRRVGASVLGLAAEFWVAPKADRWSVFSFRGQVLPADSLLNTVDVELIYGGIKYILKVPPRVSWMPLTLWSLEGVLIPVLSHPGRGFSHAWVPGCPTQPTALEPEHLGVENTQA